jgi:hypothetical protein
MSPGGTIEIAGLIRQELEPDCKTTRTTSAGSAYSESSIARFVIHPSTPLGLPSALKTELTSFEARAAHSCYCISLLAPIRSRKSGPKYSKFGISIKAYQASEVMTPLPASQYSTFGVRDSAFIKALLELIRYAIAQHIIDAPCKAG